MYDRVGCRMQYVRVCALVLAQVPVEIGAEHRAASLVCDRVLRVEVSSATICRVAARCFTRFRVDGENTAIGLHSCGADSLGSWWVCNVIYRISRRFSSSRLLANTLGTGRWLSATSVVKRLGLLRAACVVRRTSCCN